MPRTQNEGLAEVPTFTPHRANVVANDAAPPSATIKYGHGLDSTGYVDIVAQAKLSGTITTATIEPLYWSDLDGAYVKPEATEAVTVTASRSIIFRTRGRRFFLHVSALAGAAPRVDIDVAGAANPPRLDHA